MGHAPVISDPLTVACDHCGAEVGQRCMTLSDWARKPHKVRVRLAQAVAAHADPALDAWFPQLGPCRVCGRPGLGQRHRVIDVIAGMLAAGEDPDDVAEDYGLPGAAVAAVADWAERWPGAWSLAAAFAAWLPQGGVGLKRGRPFVRVGGFDHPPAGVFHGGQVAAADLAFDGVRGYALERGDLGGGHGRHARHGSTRLPTMRASYGTVKLTG